MSYQRTYLIPGICARCCSEDIQKKWAVSSTFQRIFSSKTYTLRVSVCSNCYKVLVLVRIIEWTALIILLVLGGIAGWNLEYSDDSIWHGLIVGGVLAWVHALVLNNYMGTVVGEFRRDGQVRFVNKKYDSVFWLINSNKWNSLADGM